MPNKCNGKTKGLASRYAKNSSFDQFYNGFCTCVSKNTVKHTQNATFFKRQHDKTNVFSQSWCENNIKHMLSHYFGANQRIESKNRLKESNERIQSMNRINESKQGIESRNRIKESNQRIESKNPINESTQRIKSTNRINESNQGIESKNRIK